MKSLWNGALSFGLVSIPIKVYSGTEVHGPRFRFVHARDGSPIRHARICEREGKEVPFSEVARTLAGERVSAQEIAAARPAATGRIDVLGFCWAEEIDPIYFQKPYLLEPGAGADRAYAVFREALHRTQRVGLAQFVHRGRFHLGLVKPRGDALVLVQMRLHEEIRRPEGLKLPEAAVARRKEVEMAVALVNHLSRPFHPERYRDAFVARLGEKRVSPPTEREPDGHLTRLLRESLEAA